MKEHLLPTGNDGGEPTDRPRRTTTKRIVNPRLEIGSVSFEENQVGTAQIHTHQDDHSEFRSASVTLNPPFKRPLGLPRRSQNL